MTPRPEPRERAGTPTVSATVARLVRLGGPIAAGRIAIVGMGIVDLIVVGRLAGDELPHLTLAYAIAGPLTIAGIGLMLGVQVLAARAAGAGTPATAGNVWRRGLVVAIVAAGMTWLAVLAAADPFYRAVGVAPDVAAAGARLAYVVVFSIVFHLIFVASANFLEAIEKPVPGAVAMWLATGLNLSLNLWLVPRYGAMGCAWTTVLARLFLAAAMVGTVMLLPSVKPFVARSTARIRYGELIRIGGAATISGLVEAGAFATMGLVAVRISPESMAVFSIATGGLLSGVGMLSAGLGAASAVLVAQAIGADDRHHARRVGWIAIGFNAVLMLGIGLVSILLAQPIAEGFTSNAAIAALFASVMWLTALLFSPDLGQMVADPTLRALGENWFPTAVRLVAFVGLAPALAIFLVEFRDYDVTGVFWAIIIASSAAYAVLLGRLAVLR